MFPRIAAVFLIAIALPAIALSGPYVEYEIAQRPEEPDYYAAAYHLAERCIAYRKILLRRAPTVTWRQDAL